MANPPVPALSYLQTMLAERFEASYG
uniref:Uncharacterized protein n=1 Tax=Anguilla anguilla TaxID=7936 RepID=A0A0E9XNV8_ANGAN